MSVSSAVCDNGRALKISINGRFDFSQHAQFREAYRNGGENLTRYVVDMGDVQYMDSSALGMLLMLREHAGSGSAQIRIERCAEGIKQILTIANFQKLFEID